MKPILIITHGMGTHTEESFKKEVVDSIMSAYNEYPSFKSKKIEDVIDIECVEYDSILTEHREKMAEDASNIFEVLSGIPGQGNIEKLTTMLTGYATKLGDNKFFNTHLFDVLLYRFTVLGELCRIKLGLKIIKEVGDRGGPFVHVLGHSLGTSVMHDTLATCYSKGYMDNCVVKSLSPKYHRLSSVHMVANVSRILESFAHVDNSIVNPGEGCTNYYREYRHKFDPFTWVKPFDPTEVHPWVPLEYRLVQTKRISQFNTHDVAHYIQNPLVHREMIRFFDKAFKPSKNERHHADKEFKDKTVLGKYKQVAQKAEDINFSDPNSLLAFYKSASAFKKMIEAMGGKFL